MQAEISYCKPHLISNAQVAKFEQPVSLDVLAEHAAWQASDVWDADRMLVPVTEEQWDFVIDALQT